MAEELRKLRCPDCGKTKLIFVLVAADGTIGSIKCHDCHQAEERERRKKEATTRTTIRPDASSGFKQNETVYPSQNGLRRKAASELLDKNRLTAGLVINTPRPPPESSTSDRSRRTSRRGPQSGRIGRAEADASGLLPTVRGENHFRTDRAPKPNSAHSRNSLREVARERTRARRTSQGTAARRGSRERERLTLSEWQAGTAERASRASRVTL